MKKRLIIPVLFALIAVALAACGGAGGNSAAEIKATWINPTVNGDTVSISSATLAQDTIVHFKTAASGGNIASMAYVLNGTTYVRANICPPCRSTGFSLKGDTLVCDTCGTIFNAVNGMGVSGACVDYPKAAVDYTTTGDGISMTTAALLNAYQNTLRPGTP
jgi:hypothetical protein